MALKKFLGLWYGMFSAFLIAQGYENSAADTSLFHLQERVGYSFCLSLCRSYSVTGTMSAFVMKDRGPRLFLGFEVV